jgi:hypothetical protein
MLLVSPLTAVNAHPKFGVCPMCVAAVGTVAASSAASYAASRQVSGSQVAVATGVSTVAGSALGGLLFATKLLEPIGLVGSIVAGMLTSGLSTWAILSSQKSPPPSDNKSEKT